jgi:hypothetical protein
MFRNLLLCASVFSLGVVFAASNTFDTGYAGGTVGSIPTNAKGQLDLSDSTSLQFHYGKPTYKVPYSKITSIEVSGHTHEAWTGKVTKHLPFMKQKQLLTIGFQGDKGRSESMQLALAPKTIASAVPVLESRSGKKAAGSAAAKTEVAGKADPSSGNGYEPWWGDRYWKTNRNAQVWEKK